MSTSPRPDPAGSTRYWLTGPGWERLRERPEGPTSSGSGEQDSDPEGVAMMLVARGDGVGWRLEGTWSDAVVANRFLAHLATRGFSSATIRAYAYDLVNFGRFALERRVSVADAAPEGRGPVGGWSASLGACLRAWSRRRWPRSWPTLAPTATGRSRWGCCWVGCGRARSVACGWPRWILACAGCG